MKYIIIFIFTVILAVIVTSCGYVEEDIVPSNQLDIISRFDFPEGDNPWDTKLIELNKTFEVIPIYKSYTEADFNKKWTGLSGTIYTFNEMSDEMAPVYIDFLVDEIFYYYNPEIANKVLPMYFYIVDNFRQGAQAEQIMAYHNSGFDFWYIAYYSNQPNFPHSLSYPGGLEYPSDVETLVKWHSGSELSEDEQEVIRACRNAGIYMYIEKSIDRELIEEPAGFKNGVDYTTKITYSDNDLTDPDNFMNRGFVHRVEPRTIIRQDLNIYLWHFRTLRKQYSLYSLAVPNFDFKCYIRMGMRFTKDEFEVQYPPATYPLINQRYSLVVNHMKDAYGIDLPKIAEGIKY